MTGFFSKLAYFKVIFSASNMWLICETRLLFNPANFQGFRVFFKEKNFHRGHNAQDEIKIMIIYPFSEVHHVFCFPHSPTTFKNIV